MSCVVILKTLLISTVW